MDSRKSSCGAVFFQMILWSLVLPAVWICVLPAVEAEPLETAEFTLPAEFDRVLAGYNEIQKQQGLDLSRYAKKTLTRYTYTVTNYEGYEGTVYINLLQHRDRIVGCDICSADPAGFVSPLKIQE